ncbi:hypothetical protein [Streptomyces sp. WMMC897]|uniref:hypothetical protein n=1 Tax=Streptomyces sp. WMMC897 TaxID=3014782 RepID=UPI003FCEC85A
MEEARNERPTPRDRGRGPGRGPGSDRDAGERSGSGERSGPAPEPIRFYGTSWVDHSGGYAARRAGLALGAFAAAALGVLVLRLAHEGLALAETGGLINILLIVAFAMCSSLAFSRTWAGYTRRPERPEDRDPGTTGSAAPGSQGIKLIGFLGVLLAYGVRSLVEAPGERLHRTEYEQAVSRYQRRRGARTGNPAARRDRRGRKR